MKRIGRKFALMDKVSAKAAYPASLAIMAIVILMTVEYVSRRVFNKPTMWTMDVASALQVLLTFSAAPFLLVKEEHINMDAVLTFVSKRVQHVLLSIGSVLAAVYCGFMTYYSWQMSMASLQMGERSRTFYTMPMAIVKFMAFAGFLLLVLQLLRRAQKYFDLARSTRDAEQGTGG